MAIHEDLAPLVVPIDELKPHPDNPRRGNIKRIAESLSRFGQVRPIVARKDGTIVAGNHTYHAAIGLGWKAIAVAKVNLTEQEALAYMLADNKLSDDATWDDQGLMRVLDSLVADGSLEATGFTPDDLEDLLAVMESIPETSHQDFTGDYAEPPSATADRWADRNEGQNKEVVFLLPKDDYEEFIAAVTKLKEHWSEESMARTIFNAVVHVMNSEKASWS